MKIESPEVLYSTESIYSLDSNDISKLVEKAKLTERKRIRICVHFSPAEKLHEMIIVHFNDTYVRPHKHINKTESFHIIQGACDVVLFDDVGNVETIIPMGDSNYENRSFYYRLAEPVFHSLIVRSDVIVFHEVTNGPFNRSDTIFAEWSPDEINKEGVNLFMNRLWEETGLKII
jgi:cupin fold WbuC family metalloprotein